jgi:hypothetical protein
MTKDSSDELKETIWDEILNSISADLFYILKRRRGFMSTISYGGHKVYGDV